MELLSFDSTSPNAHYDAWISECRAALPELPVFWSDVAVETVNPGSACLPIVVAQCTQANGRTPASANKA